MSKSALLLILILIPPRATDHAIALEHDQIEVRVANSGGAPVAGVLIAFTVFDFKTPDVKEIPAGSCLTESFRGCSIGLHDSPRDSSGFIRGRLSVGGRGARALTWPGGRIEVELELSESGQLNEHQHGPYKAESDRIARGTENNATGLIAETATDDTYVHPETQAGSSTENPERSRTREHPQGPSDGDLLDSLARLAWHGLLILMPIKIAAAIAAWRHILRRRA